MIGVVEILLILVAVFAAGRAFRNGPDLRRLIATALFAIAGVYGVVGLAWAFRWGFWPSGHPHRGAPGPSDMAMISVMCLMVAWFLIWLGVRVGRGGGLPGPIRPRRRGGVPGVLRDDGVRGEIQIGARSRLLRSLNEGLGPPKSGSRRPISDRARTLRLTRDRPRGRPEEVDLGCYRAGRSKAMTAPPARPLTHLGLFPRAEFRKPR